MDLLEFEAQDLYFDQPDGVEVENLISRASLEYADGDAELPLLQAYLRAPESLNVLVALNRFYYYQHRLEEALLISEKALGLIRQSLDLPDHWENLEAQHIEKAPKDQLTKIRLYLFTLKSIGFLHMRLHHLSVSEAIFSKLVSVDERDRLGAKPLLELVHKQLENCVSTAKSENQKPE